METDPLAQQTTPEQALADSLATDRALTTPQPEPALENALHADNPLEAGNTNDDGTLDVLPSNEDGETNERQSRLRTVAKWAGAAALAVATYKVVGNAIGSGHEAAGAAFLGMRMRRNTKKSDKAADRALELLDQAGEVRADQEVRQDSAGAIINSITYKKPSTALEDFRKVHRTPANAPKKAPYVPPVGTVREMPLHEATELAFMANENSQARRKFKDAVQNFSHVLLDDHGHVVDEATLKERMAAGRFSKEQMHHIKGVRRYAEQLHHEIEHTRIALDQARHGADTEGVAAREEEAKLIDKAGAKIDTAVERAAKAAELRRRLLSRP